MFGLMKISYRSAIVRSKDNSFSSILNAPVRLFGNTKCSKKSIERDRHTCTEKGHANISYQSPTAARDISPLSTLLNWPTPLSRSSGRYTVSRSYSTQHSRFYCTKTSKRKMVSNKWMALRFIIIPDFGLHRFVSNFWLETRFRFGLGWKIERGATQRISRATASERLDTCQWARCNLQRISVQRFQWGKATTASDCMYLCYIWLIMKSISGVRVHDSRSSVLW